MESIIIQFFLHNWQRKLLALVTAIILWFFVSHSITEIKVIRNVPIRISNLPSDKTVVGLLSNGLLNRRINLTLTGAKDVIEEIEPGDLEVNIDASAIDHNDWIVQINKKNLRSLNPAIDLSNNINSVSHSDFVIKLNRLTTAKVPIHILPPKGEAPEGYEFLDIWPQQLMQTLSGPEEEIERLKAKGLEITFDLNDISKAELDTLKGPQQGGNNNEISFSIPYDWKQVEVPFRNHLPEEINDSDAQNLRIDFLRLEFLPIDRQLPIHVFYPTKNLSELNPASTSIASGNYVVSSKGVSLFARPLYVKNVSRLFLNVIRDYLEITIIASSKNESEILPWDFEVVTPHDLEDTYVAYQMAH
ncbi:MAG: CdaR family protein, partial [Parachlamydiaceae bacterium]